jgi:hypothetical protein
MRVIPGAESILDDTDPDINLYPMHETLVVGNENPFPFDVDDTIVMHTRSNEIPPGDKVEVQDPIDYNKTITMQINRPMVRLIEEEYFRGSFIIVWSRGGFRWAVNVCKAVGIYNKVHIIMTKPKVYGDDKDVGDWLKDRVYLKPDCIYKTANKE